MYHKRILLTTVVSFFGLFLITAHAQTTTYGDTIFFDDFGKHPTRVSTPYMPGGSYAFADASGNEDEKADQDNYYAIVDPRHIADAGPSNYFWTSTSLNANLPSGAKPYTTDHTGDTNGAVMVINAGKTVNYIYKRPVSLKTGFRYQFSFWIYVVAPNAQFIMKVENQNNNSTSTFKGVVFSTVGLWQKYTLAFSVPLLSAAVTKNDVIVGLQNEYSVNMGYDYYIDDVLLSTLHTDPVTITASNISPVCQGQPILFNAAPKGDATPFVYAWTGPNGFTSTDQNPVLSNTTIAATGTYSVTVTDALGQTATATTHATVNPAPNSDFTLSSETIDGRHNSVTLSITPEKNVVYEWDLGDGATSNQTTINYAYNITGNIPEYTIKLTAKDNIGCSSTSTKKINVVPFIPNVFTPNGDEVNDLFMAGYDVQVFDRNGMVLYKGNTGWNGTYKGKIVDNDTYYYYLNFNDVNKNVQTRKGFVTLKR